MNHTNYMFWWMSQLSTTRGNKVKLPFKSLMEVSQSGGLISSSQRDINITSLSKSEQILPLNLQYMHVFKNNPNQFFSACL